MTFPEAEVRAAYDNFVAVGDSGDWIRADGKLPGAD